MTGDLILSVAGRWFGLQEGTWQALPERPPLSARSMVFTDVETVSGVMAVGAKPQFAAAVIGKRLRAEGLVDGDVHVLITRVLAVGGGCRALYAAVPVPAWQQLFGWLEREAAIGLVYTANAAMQALSARHDAVLYRSARQLRLLISGSEILEHYTATAYSDDPDDLDAALQNLLEQVPGTWASGSDKPSVLWCDLLAPTGADAMDADTRLVARFAAALGVEVEVAPSVQFAHGSAMLRTAAPFMAAALSWRRAANPLPVRLAAVADRYHRAAASAIALVAIGMLALAGFWSAHGWRLNEQAQQVRAQTLQVVQRSAGAGVSPEAALAAQAPLIAFVESLDSAQRSPDPLSFMQDLRLAGGTGVRVLRVRLSAGGAFRIEGVPVAGMGGERALSQFLQSLVSRGYQVNTEDPGNQSAQPGFFSYTVRPIGIAAGMKQ